MRWCSNSSPKRPKQYVIGPGDKITVIIAGRPELSGQHTVGPDGNITLPFAGTVNILDTNRDQAAELDQARPVHLLSFDLRHGAH